MKKSSIVFSLFIVFILHACTVKKSSTSYDKTNDTTDIKKQPVFVKIDSASYGNGKSRFSIANKKANTNNVRVREHSQSSKKKDIVIPTANSEFKPQK